MRLNLVGAFYLELCHLLSTPSRSRCTTTPVTAVAEMTDDLPALARGVTGAGVPAALPLANEIFR